jgi:DNA-directed RNA polymerase III subunit RPC1
MVACVGQQIISGHRVPNGFVNRSLPHFPIGCKHFRSSISFNVGASISGLAIQRLKLFHLRPRLD